MVYGLWLVDSHIKKRVLVVGAAAVWLFINFDLQELEPWLMHLDLVKHGPDGSWCQLGIGGRIGEH